MYFASFNRLYGNTGLCSACNKLIPAFEMVMRAKRNVYHLECFACQQCSHRYSDLMLFLCVKSDMHQTCIRQRCTFVNEDDDDC